METLLSIELTQIRAERQYEGTLIAGDRRYPFSFRILAPLATIDPENQDALLRQTSVQLRKEEGGDIGLEIDQRWVLAQVLIQNVKGFCELPDVRRANTLAAMVDYFQTPPSLAPQGMLRCEISDHESEAVIKAALEKLP